MSKTLSVISWFTLACAGWLAVMELLLRHPGYELRAGVAVLIGLISVAAILAPAGKLGTNARGLLQAGAVVLVLVGGQAFYRNLRAAHFEGYVVIISAALVVQGVLTLVSEASTGNGAGHRRLHDEKCL